MTVERLSPARTLSMRDRHVSQDFEANLAGFTNIEEKMGFRLEELTDHSLSLTDLRGLFNAHNQPSQGAQACGTLAQQSRATTESPAGTLTRRDAMYLDVSTTCGCHHRVAASSQQAVIVPPSTTA